MKLSVDILAEKMQHYKIRVYSTQEVTAYLEGVRFFDKDLKIVDKNYLYVGYASELPKLNEIRAGVSVLCVGIPQDLTSEQNLHFNLIVINEHHSLVKLFNEILELFLFFEKWECQLHELILSNCSVQKLVDVSDKIIGWPISVIDRAEKTLAASKFDESDDIIWAEIRKGYIRTELLQQDSVKTSEVAKHHNPVQMYSTISNRIILTQAIRINGNVVGFTAVHHTQPGRRYFSWGIVQLLDFFTQQVAALMRSNEFFNLSRGMMFEYLLVDLIEGKTNNESVIADRLAFLEWDLDGSKKIIRVEVNKRSLNNERLKIMREQIEYIILSSRSIIYDDGLVVITKNIPDSLLTDDIKSKLIAWLKKNNSCCGVSNSFTMLNKTSNYYNQTRKAIRFGTVLNPGQRIYYYHDYTMIHVAELLAKKIDLTSLLHPSMKKLLTLCEKNPYFFETLKVYLNTERNIAVSSKLLYIHRNTMIYRIKRLEEEMGCDFSDFYTRKSLLFSIDIIEYIINFRRDEHFSNTKEIFEN